MESAEKKQFPVKEGLWIASDNTFEYPQLIGNRCTACEELFFPKKENGICTICQSTNLEEVRLSRKGKIYSYAVIMQRPPEYYRGPVPYAEGFVELPDGIRIETLFTDCNFDQLKIGMKVEMVIEKLHDDEKGNEIITFKFRPTRDGKE